MTNADFKKQTEKFFDEYNGQKQARTLNQLDRFLMKHHYFDISKFIVDNIPRQSVDAQTQFLDIGCGAGDYLIFLANQLRDGRYYGVDISSGAIHEAKLNSQKKSLYSVDPFLVEIENTVSPEHFTFQQTDGRKLPFADKSFDIVTFVMILHHAENYAELISEAKRVLKDNGRLIIADLNGDHFPYKFALAMFKIIPKFIKNKICQNGLILEDGKFPLRSKSNIRKLEKIIDRTGLKICFEKNRYSLMVFVLYIFNLLYNDRLFFIYKPFILFFVLLDKALGRIWKQSCEFYALVCQPNSRLN